ncbi:MAG TPA: NmrA family NAD(P)-binding protein [Thermoanaerobaculia bacterium]|nr:NmrA family NAD(P)-binding protein [Thermoanaerobaculia bacterium]
MSTPRRTVLVVGATGSIGRLVVEEAARQGHVVRALVRDARIRTESGDRA